MRKLLAYCLALFLFATSSVALAADGAALWQQNKCAKCHGPAGKADTKYGRKKGLPDMTSMGWQALVTDDAIRLAMTKGVDKVRDAHRRRMKPVFDIKPDQVDALLALIRSWGQQPELATNTETQ